MNADICATVPSLSATADSSFAENFYGLKRIRTPTKPLPLTTTTTPAPSPPLTPSEIRRSLLFLILVPYLKTKLDDLYEGVSGGASSRLFGDEEIEENELEDLADPNSTALHRLLVRARRVFRKVYPLVNATYHGSVLCYSIAYLFGKTPYYTPWLKLIGLEVKRMSVQDYREHYTRMSGPASATSQSRSLARRSVDILGATLSGALEFLKILLPMSIFFFKFLEWWYSSEFARGGGGGGGVGQAAAKEVPPPERIKPDRRGTPLPPTPNTCPLCQARPINNPTALPSGYVFCYTCAFHYVEEHGRCPVTWTRVRGGVGDLRKVYAAGTGGV
ncbi:Pex12 amino terminal region-domain-containing protein [Jimgerdemannia flammicorona]|uniref:Peroxisome assembly protein 12 n=1 Tax=Jimgerdemannia flammicorona TaxID=994334 RepID=A0A433BAE6_9FUNG|nr:Pex12 amino terminal region-domain-containing protein [Jimgerdemannia flammicorona]